MTQFELKDSGSRQEFDTGARRDLQKGRGRPDLISTIFKQRLAVVMEKGAEKYGDRNWELGIPLSRFASSAMRHLDQAFDGQADEDHLGQAAFNIMGWMHTKELIQRGKLSESLDDLPNTHPTSYETYQTMLEIAAEFLHPQAELASEPLLETPERGVTRDDLANAGMVEGLDGVWRGKTTIDESVKNPGERQTPIFAQPAVFDPPKEYGETGELT